MEMRSLGAKNKKSSIGLANAEVLKNLPNGRGIWWWLKTEKPFERESHRPESLITYKRSVAIWAFREQYL